MTGSKMADAILKLKQFGSGGTFEELSASNLKKIHLSFPSLGEQHHVASCLGSLDDLIVAENRRLEALKQYKQGLMQQLFPQPGETVPRLRFPEFRRSPSWKLRELGDMCGIVNGGTPKSTVAEYWNGNIQWLTPKDMGQMTGREIGSTPRTISSSGLGASSATLIPAQSVILSTRAPIGHLAMNTTPMAFNQGCRGLVSKEGVDSLFVYYNLSANRYRLKQFGSGGTFEELSASNLKKIHLSFPSLGEQHHVASCLGSLDDLIVAEGRGLDILRQHKRGLMQQLFPNPEAT